MRDINARNIQWGTSSNKKGSEFLEWAEQHGWTINASGSSSFTSPRRKCNVNLMICQNIQFESLTSVQEGDWIGISDHKPIIAETYGAAASATPKIRVPSSKRSNPDIATREEDLVEEQVLHLNEVMEHGQSKVQLED